MTSVWPPSGHVDWRELTSVPLCDSSLVGSLLSFEGLLPFPPHTPHGCFHEDHIFPAQDYWSPPGLLGGRRDAGTCTSEGRNREVLGAGASAQLLPEREAGSAVFLGLVPSQRPRLATAGTSRGDHFSSTWKVIQSLRLFLKG